MKKYDRNRAICKIKMQSVCPMASTQSQCHPRSHVSQTDAASDTMVNIGWLHLHCCQTNKWCHLSPAMVSFKTTVFFCL